MLMQDDTGWQDFGCYLGGRALGHPTPHVDQLAKEGAMFTNWYGQASCIVKHPSIKRFPGGASNDLIPDLQHPENPVPLVDPTKPINVKGVGD
jgi:hypothetical protein